MSSLGIGDRVAKISNGIEVSNEKVIDKIVQVDIDKLQKNALNFYDDEYDLETLAESIREVGILEPLIITKDYVIISGHRRYNASKLIGMNSIPAKFIDGDNNLDLMLVEANRYRQKTQEEVVMEVEFLENYFEKLARDGKKPKGRIRDLIAHEVGVSPSTVARAMKKIKHPEIEKSKTDKDNSVKEMEKLQKQLKKVIKLVDAGEIIIAEYLVHTIHKLYDHIDLNDLTLENVPENQSRIDDLR